MTIKAFSREYFKGYIQGYIDLLDLKAPSHLQGKPTYVVICKKCRNHFYFDDAEQAPETDLICECGYTVVEYDKEEK